MNMMWGLLGGALFSVGDAVLLCWILRKAASYPERARRWLGRGLTARGLLTMAAVCAAYLLPFMNAAGVVIALLLQKGVLMVLILLRWRRNRG